MLFVNCLHYKYPILLGISEPTYDAERLREMKEYDRRTFEYEGKKYTGYEASRMQRKLETEIRRQKDRANIFAASGDDDGRRAAQEKINLLTKKYKDFSDTAGLPYKTERMSVARFHRVKSLSEKYAKYEARAGKIFNVVPPTKGDHIQPQSVFKELRKSDVGREIFDYIVENNVEVEINYTTEHDGSTRGYCYRGGKYIFVYADITKTIKQTTKTIIHEGTHLKYSIGGDQYSEAICFLQEKKHVKKNLTFSDIKATIKEVKELYPELKWRNNR